MLHSIVWKFFFGILFYGAAALSIEAHGLSVDGQGDLIFQNKPFRGIGVNYYDAFVRALENPARTNFDAGFCELALRRIPFARFAAGGYWPSDWKLYQTNRTVYFERFDELVRCAERHGIGLIPSLFWHYSTVPDLVGEPLNRWGDTNSRTHAFMRKYTAELVERYENSAAIWGWEFGNEYNLTADLPNAMDHRPQVVPALGTPVKRTADDELTHAMVRIAVKAFAEEVRLHDKTRIILSGHAFPRASAWHQIREKSWKKDSPEQFTEVLAADSPNPVNTFSVRAYELTNDLSHLPQAMAESRKSGKPLIVGEFGVPGDISRQTFHTILNALETNDVSMAALWVFDFAAQDKDWNVSSTNARSWQLEEIQRFNARFGRGTQFRPAR
jgi:hypothetical protein